jgi:DNA-binding IclR family transcriptional regulator
MTHRAITAVRATLAVITGAETAKAVASRLGIGQRRARRVLAMLERCGVARRDSPRGVWCVDIDQARSNIEQRTANLAQGMSE